MLGLYFIYVHSFQTNNTILRQINPVSRAGIRTRDLLNDPPITIYGVRSVASLKRAMLGLYFVYVHSFQTNNTILRQINPVSRAGIRTRDLLNDPPITIYGVRSVASLKRVMWGL